MTMTVLSKAMIGVASIAALAAPAFATPVNESEWQDHQGMLSTRIVTASPDVLSAATGKVREGDGTVLFAWEAKLAEGWKTYWRSPGEAGLPVRVYNGDQDIDLYYPVPERFELFGLQTFGYSKAVMIPFDLDVDNGDLTLRADFMVCKEICVPFEAKYELSIDRGTVGNIVADTKIEHWIERLPTKDGSAPGGLQIESVELAGQAGHQSLVVDIAADNQLTNADLLAELDEGTQFPTPKLRLLADGRKARFILPAISSKAERNLAGERVRLTLNDGRGNAVEQFFTLPAQ